MSKVTPREYYVCDYCGKKFDREWDIMYTNNSGLRNICYDMCSDECLKNHLRFLKIINKRNPIVELEPIEEYFKDLFLIKGKSYHCATDNAEELFNETIKAIKEMWKEINSEE